MILLAFDVGRKKTGIAIGNTETGTARPLAVTRGGRERQAEDIAKHIHEWQPKQLIVGLPTHMDGREHRMTRFCQVFADMLKQRFSLPVSLVDERLSTITARAVGGGVNADSVSAAIVLQDWLCQQTRTKNAA